MARRERRYSRAMCLVCVPIMVRDEASALGDALQARLAGAELVELRIDSFFEGLADDEERAREARAVERLVAECPLPCIVTCRVKEEGGHYEGDDEARAGLLEHLAASKRPPRFVDVEGARLAKSAALRRAAEHLGGAGTTIVVSSHDFSGRPSDLSRRLIALREDPACGVLKVAYRARSLRDSLELLDIVHERDRPTIGLGMGEFGMLTRVLAGKFGAMLTFASLRDSSTTAPGQPTVAELTGQYRFRSIGEKTRVYGVVGWPVSQSIGVFVHNAAFEAAGHDGVYLPLPVGAAEGDVEGSYASLKATLLSLIDHPLLGFGGCSVTLPHKEGLVRLGLEQGWSVEPEAAAIGAANTLVVERGSDGSVTGARVMNTDAPAAAECLQSALGSLHGRRISVLGAGGAARAVAYGAASRGAAVRIFNRDAQRAARLAEELGERLGVELGHGSLATAAAAEADAIVNCTSVGMKTGPEPGGAAVDVSEVASRNRGTVVFDTVYSPLVTPLIARARERGLRTIEGVEMYVGQACAQSAAWTGMAPARALFERLARERLGGV